MADPLEKLAEHLQSLGDLGVTHLDLNAPRRQVEPEIEPETEPEAEPTEELTVIRADLGDCTRCKLHSRRKNIVFGVGDPKAELMFVGEAPGEDEDIQGIPFVGKAGQLLTRIIAAIGLDRSQVYIANILKCRPPDNRNPEPDEVAVCLPFLHRQIDAIHPKILVALGRVAAQNLLRIDTPIGKLRGRFYDLRGIPVMVTFHPSYLLRIPAAKREVWEDMQKVRDTLKSMGSRYYT